MAYKPTSQTRTFGGKRYSFYWGYKHKGEAVKQAAHLVKNGYLARVIKSAEHGYLVYSRRK